LQLRVYGSNPFTSGFLSMVHSDDIEDLRSEKIIAFSRQNLSYSER